MTSGAVLHFFDVNTTKASQDVSEVILEESCTLNED